jgi:hypothetical protein
LRDLHDWSLSNTRLHRLLLAGGAAAVFCPGEMTRAARAMIEDGPAAFCAATTPTAASPNVTKAAMTATTTRIASSTVVLVELA